MVVVVVFMCCHIQLSTTPWTAAHQASLSFTISQSLLKLRSIELIMPANHLILCHSVLLLPSIFPSIRVFSNESALWIRWPKYSSFSFSISPSNEYAGLNEMVYRVILQYSNTYSCFIADGEFQGNLFLCLPTIEAQIITLNQSNLKEPL